jgi:hypothetical protein
MAQLTIRAGDELVGRVRLAAGAAGRSMNEYVVSVLDAATNPELAGNEAEQIRARLARAGLLAVPIPKPGPRPSRAAVEEAGRRAVVGRPVSQYVSDGRGDPLR